MDEARRIAVNVAMLPGLLGSEDYKVGQTIFYLSGAEGLHPEPDGDGACLPTGNADRTTKE